MKIPAQRYDFSDEDIKFVLSEIEKVLKSRDFLTLGRYCQIFEEEFSRYIGSPSVCTNSGTSALECIFTEIGVKGKEVILPSLTFAATAFAVIKAGGFPVFADCVSVDDFSISPDNVKKLITRRTSGICVVHIGGFISESIYQILEIGRVKGIPVVEDCAHAHGSIIDGKKAGSLGIAGAFSFFSTKVITTGEGGMVTSNNKKIIERTRIMRDQAKVQNQNIHKEIGYNFRMTEFQAILGIAQLRNIEKFISERERIARIYSSYLDDAKIPYLRPYVNSRPNYYKFTVFATNTDEITKALKENYGISLQGKVYDIPLHKQPVFRNLKDSKRIDLKNSERICKNHICLPIYPSLSDDEATYVAKSVVELLKNKK